MQGIVNALLNTILVGIPEEAFIVIIALVLLKRFDMLDIRMWRSNLKWIMIAALPVTLTINILQYIVVIPKPTISMIALILMVILMNCIVYKNNYDFGKKDILKTIICTILSFLILGIIESLYYPVSLSLLHKSISFFNNNFIYNFLLSFPTRVLQFCIIICILIKKNNRVSINLFSTIINNNFFINSFASIVSILIILLIYFTKLIMIDGILTTLNIIDQLLIIAIVISIPISLITFFLVLVNYLLTKQKQIQQTYENLIIKDDISPDVEV